MSTQNRNPQGSLKRLVRRVLRFVLWRRLKQGELVQQGDIACDDLGWFMVHTGPYGSKFSKPYGQTERTHYRRLRTWAAATDEAPNDPSSATAGRKASHAD